MCSTWNLHPTKLSYGRLAALKGETGQLSYVSEKKLLSESHRHLVWVIVWKRFDLYYHWNNNKIYSESMRGATPRPARQPRSARGLLSKHAGYVSTEVRAGWRGTGTPHSLWAGEESGIFVTDRAHRESGKQPQSSRPWPQKEGRNNRAAPSSVLLDCEWKIQRLQEFLTCFHPLVPIFFHHTLNSMWTELERQEPWRKNYFFHLWTFLTESHQTDFYWQWWGFFNNKDNNSHDPTWLQYIIKLPCLFRLRDPEFIYGVFK